MRYPFPLRSITGSALLDTGSNRSLVNTRFARIANLALGPSRVISIKVADGYTIPVHHETISFTIVMGTLTSTIQAPVTEVEGFDIILGLDWLRQNKPHVNWATSILTVS